MESSKFNKTLRLIDSLLTTVYSPSESEAVLSRVFKELMTTPEVAALKGVGLRTVQSWIDKGQLPCMKKGSVTYVLRSDAIRFVPPSPGNPNWSRGHNAQPKQRHSS